MGTWLSLSRRIVVTVALGLALILLLFGIVALWTIRESTEAAYQERVTIATALARHADDVLRYIEVTLEREATSMSIESGSPLAQENQQRLANLRTRLGNFAIISLTDAQGTTLWTEPRRADVIIGSPLTHPSVALVLQTGRSQITEFQAPAAGNLGFACIAVPVFDQNRKVRGVLMAEIDPSHAALNLVPSDELDAGMMVQLINTKGDLLGGKDDHAVGLDPTHQTLLANFVSNRTAGYALHEAQPWDTFGSHVVAYAPLSLLPSWGVLIEQPRDLAVTIPERIKLRLGLFGIAALFLAIAVAWYDVRRVVRPLQELTTAAERFAAGKLDEPVPITRQDEVGILASAFETMRVRLRNSLEEVAQWNSELEQRVQARTAEVERHNRELAHLNSIVTTLSSTLDVKVMLDSTLDDILAITGADSGCFRLIGPQGGTQHTLMAARGLGRQSLVRPNCRESCLCLEAERTCAVAIAHGADIPDQVVACQAVKAGSVAVVPLLAGSTSQGALVLTSQQEGFFQPDHLVRLATIGCQIGIALARARLYDDLRAREQERAELLQRVMDGQEEERRRLAQELHDETSQALASLHFGLERLATYGGDLQRTGQIARELQSIASQTLRNVHRLAVELRPSVLDDVGFIPAVDRFLQEYGEKWSLDVDFAVVGATHTRLISAAETVVYRIVQAAITNVAQHAHARHVSVLIEQRADRLVVVVEDDGCGFDLNAIRQAPLDARLGLAGMEERANLIGATLTIETSPGAGTTVFLEVPLASNSRKEEPDVEAASAAR